jgi:GT2 family glycosyltransferase
MQRMDISVVIPTCDRAENLQKLLFCLEKSTHPFREIIIVDATQDSGGPLKVPANLNTRFLRSEPSVTIQRNKGIEAAAGDWIFLCDDDIEVPADYIAKLANHFALHPEAGAISGLVLQKEKGEWQATYPESSASLIVKYLLGLSIWGTIQTKNVFTGRIKKYFEKKGNHIAKTGWPVITDFKGEYFLSPVYGLGASLIKKEWLLNSPYDEVLDPHGIGDHYGVAVGFPGPVNVITSAKVYHHQEQTNRLSKKLQYYRRVMALDYFIKTKKELKRFHVSKGKLIWSVLGSFLPFALQNSSLAFTTLKTAFRLTFRKNPYYEAAKENRKTIEPMV